MASNKLPASPFNGQKFIDSRSIEWTYDSSTKSWRSGASTREIPPVSEVEYGLLTPELKNLLDSLPKRGGGFGIITKPLLSIVPLRRDVSFRGGVKSAKINESGSEIVVESSDFRNNQFIGKAIFFTSGILKAKAYLIYSNNNDTIYLAGPDGSNAKRGDKFEIIDPLYLNKDGAIVGDIKLTSYSLDISCIDRDGNIVDGYCPNPNDQNNNSGIDIKVSENFLNEFCISIPGQVGPQGDQGPQGNKGPDGTGDGPIGPSGDDGVSSTSPSTLTGIKINDSNEVYDTAVIGLRLDSQDGKLYVLRGKVKTPNSETPAQQVIANAISRDIQFTDTEYSYEIISPPTDSLSNKDISLLFYPKHTFNDSGNLAVSDTEVIQTKLSNVIDSTILHMQKKLKDVSDEWDQKIKPFIESKDEIARKELYDIANSVAECEWGLKMEFCLGLDQCAVLPTGNQSNQSDINIPGLEKFLDGIKTKLDDITLKNPPLNPESSNWKLDWQDNINNFSSKNISPNINTFGSNQMSCDDIFSLKPDGYKFLNTLNNDKSIWWCCLTGKEFQDAYSKGLVNEYGEYYGTERDLAEVRCGQRGPTSSSTWVSRPDIIAPLVRSTPNPNAQPLPIYQSSTANNEDLFLKPPSDDPRWYTEDRGESFLENPHNPSLNYTTLEDPYDPNRPPSKSSPYHTSNSFHLKNPTGGHSFPANSILAFYVSPDEAIRTNLTTWSITFIVDVYYEDGTYDSRVFPTPDGAVLTGWDLQMFLDYIRQKGETNFVEFSKAVKKVVLRLPNMVGKSSYGKLKIKSVLITEFKNPQYISIVGSDGKTVIDSIGGGGETDFYIGESKVTPVITSVSETDCSSATLIINGSGFSTAANIAPTVEFNGIAGVVNSFTATSITVTIPTDDAVQGASTVDIEITNSDGVSIMSLALLECGKLRIDDINYITPFSMAGGTIIEVTGSFNSSTDTPTAFLVTSGGDVACSVTLSSSSAIRFTTPSLPIGLLNEYLGIKIIKGAEEITVAGVVYAHAEPPTITSINPTTAATAGGTTVIITGTKFTTYASPATPTVIIDGNPATVTSFNATTIQITTPALPIGHVSNITVTNVDLNLSVSAVKNLTIV